jgi:hypothetical protein
MAQYGAHLAAASARRAAANEDMDVAEAAAPSALVPTSRDRDPRDIFFADVCELFEKIRAVNKTGFKGSRRTRPILDAFHAAFCPVGGPRTGAYQLYRLILPNADKERAAYNLKEAALAVCLGKALGLKRNESPDFLALEGWRKSGKGNFAQTVFEVCARHMKVSGVRRATVGDVNAALDQ